MSRKARRVRYSLEPQEKELSVFELKTILRGADELVMKGGRGLLAKILKGSRDKTIREKRLDKCPVYGTFRELTLREITAKIDRAITDGYLDIEYDYRLPLLVFTDRGWEIERDTYSDELLKGFDLMIEKGTFFEMGYLKDRNRGMIFMLLDKVAVTKNSKYIPLLKVWEKTDYRKVRAKINWTIKQIENAEA